MSWPFSAFEASGQFKADQGDSVVRSTIRVS
jgi:hypothetical protein